MRLDDSTDSSKGLRRSGVRDVLTPGLGHGARLSERGMALPLALLLLVALGLIGAGASIMSDSGMRVSSAYATSNQATGAAEAAAEHGIVELTIRAQAGEDPDSVQILSNVYTQDGFKYTVTVYSKREHDGEGGRDFNKDGNKTDVVRYDRSFGYASAAASGAAGDQGYPVKILVAEATKGTSRARAEVEVARDRLTSEIQGPLVLNSPVNAVLTGSLEIDGRLHDGDGNLVNSADLNPPYADDAVSKAAAKEECNYWKAGVKIPSGADVTFQGDIKSVGHVSFDHDNLLGLNKGAGSRNFNADDPLSTFDFTPEEVLGLESGALDAYKKDASAVPDFNNLSGVNYVVSGSVPSQISGSGILIVHNPAYDARVYDCVNFPTTCKIGYALDPKNQPLPLRINSNGAFKGIIITDELVRVDGKFELLGSLASLATLPTSIPGNGDASIKWSCQAIQAAVDQGSAYSVMLSWKDGLEE